MTGGGAPVVHAAGGVVCRPAGDGEIEILVVHRPKYDDWTLPKGKLQPDEEESEAALREVEEETGLRCVLGEQLPSTSYTDARGRPKVVRYWAMTPLGGEFRVNDEVDETRWVTLDDARAVLTYDRDREVLRSFDAAAGLRSAGADPPRSPRQGR